MTESIEQIVIGLIARTKSLDRGVVKPAAELTSLGITSLDAITLAYELEQTLGLEIPNEHIESLRTVQDLIDGLHRLIADQT